MKAPTASINQAPPNPTTPKNQNQQGTNASQGRKGCEMIGSQVRVYALTRQEA